MAIFNSLTETTSYHYQVLFETEKNGYDDSDFFAIVPNEKGGFTSLQVGTTRCAWMDGVTVDAPPSMYKDYRRWEESERVRVTFLQEGWLWEKLSKKLSYYVKNLDSAQFSKVERLYENSNFWRYVFQKTSSAKRSDFMLSLRDQIMGWAMDSDSAYDTPLSPRQQDAVGRYYNSYETY